MRRSASRGPTTTRLVAASLSSTYSGADAATPSPRRWPTVKPWWPRWRPSARPRRSTISPGRGRIPPWRARNAAGSGAGEEAQVLGVGLAGDRQAGLGGQLAHARLVQIAEGEAQALQRGGRRARRACSSGPCPDRRRSGAAGRRRRRPRARSGRWPARRRPAARRARSSRRGARGRCSARTGSGSGRPRDRRGTATRRRRGTPRAGRASGAGSPISWASARAPRTAEAEQHERSASLSRSAHSSRVTPTVSPPRPHSSAATALSTPPLMATSVRPGVGSESRVGANGGAEGAVQGIRGELGGVMLGRAQAAELGGDRLRPDSSAVEDGPPAHQRHRGASGGESRPAPARVEGRRDHALCLHGHRQAHQVPARRAARRAAVPARGLRAPADRVVQVRLEGARLHRSESREIRERVRSARVPCGRARR